MFLFPFILAGVIAIYAVITWIRIMKINEESDETDGFFVKYRKKLEDYLASKSSPISVGPFLGIMTAIEIGLFLGGFLLSGKWWFGLIAMVIGPLLPRLYFSVLETKNRQRFEEAYRDALNHIAFALRAGLSVPNAIEDMANFALGDSHMRKLFLKMDIKLKAGESVPDVFEWFAKKTGSSDAEMVAAAVRMQQEVGGSEAFVLEQMAETIQNRIETRSKVNSILAEADIMIAVFDVAPVIFLVALYIIFPNYIAYYFESPLRVFLFLGVIGALFLGSFISRKMKKSVLV